MNTILRIIVGTIFFIFGVWLISIAHAESFEKYDFTKLAPKDFTFKDKVRYSTWERITTGCDFPENPVSTNVIEESSDAQFNYRRIEEVLEKKWTLHATQIDSFYIASETKKECTWDCVISVVPVKDPPPEICDKGCADVKVSQDNKSSRGCASNGADLGLMIATLLGLWRKHVGR